MCEPNKDDTVTDLEAANNLKSPADDGPSSNTESNTTNNTSQGRNDEVGAASEPSASKPPSSTRKRQWPSIKIPRTVALRIIFVLSLATTAALCAAASYTVISNLETNVGKETYESVAHSALQGAQAITRRKLHGAHVMASILSFAFPAAAQWPFVSLDGYTEINKDLAAMSQSNEYGFIPLIDPNTVSVLEWQDFMAQEYAVKGFEEHVGYSDFGFGIWKEDFSENPEYEDGRLPDMESNDYGGASNHTVLMPIVQVGHKNSTSMLFNLRSEPFRRATVDSMLDCASYGGGAVPTERRPCTVVSDMVELQHGEGPEGLIYTPVYPGNDPTTLVGMTSTVIIWKQVLENIVPDYVDGLICVISTPTQEWTFEIHNGVPVVIGDGDLHDTSYDHLAKSEILDDIETDAAASIYYTLTVYPTATMMSAFETQAPWAAAFGFVAAITLCTVIFFVYDCFMRDEVDKRQKIMEIKRQYVRFISHEIRTPLNTVCLGLELLEGELRTRQQSSSNTNDQSTNKLLETKSSSLSASTSTDSKDNEENLLHDITLDVQENAHTAVAVLNDILNYDKIESHTLSLEIDRVPIWTLLQKTVQQFQVQALNGRVGLKFITEMDDRFMSTQEDLETGALTERAATALRCMSVIGDELRLGQVLRNIISNALKFTPQNGTIEVKAKHVSEGLRHAVIPTENDKSSGHSSHHLLAPRSGSIHIQVKDSGVGLSAHQLKQMFQEGVQFDANKLQHGGGSGLGLVIAKGIVEQHGGTIRVASAGIGKGTSFHVELPLFQVEPKQEETASQASAASASKETQQKRRVLVVDDVLSNRKMLVRLLERCGHQCETAINGEAAVQMIRRDLAADEDSDNHVPFDTVLMDSQMPLMCGPDASAMLRNLGYSGIIMGITGNVLQEDTDHFRSMGADEVLAKPISIAKLQETWTKLSAPPPKEPPRWIIE